MPKDVRDYGSIKVKSNTYRLTPCAPLYQWHIEKFVHPEWVFVARVKDKKDALETIYHLAAPPEYIQVDFDN